MLIISIWSYPVVERDDLKRELQSFLFDFEAIQSELGKVFLFGNFYNITFEFLWNSNDDESKEQEGDLQVLKGEFKFF